MSRDSSYRLHAVTVVVTAASHNPSMLNPDFLKTQRIVPSGWEVSESVSTPPVSMIMFANGIQWVMDESVLNVIERCDSGFQDGYAIYQTVIRYLETVTHVPYRNLGLNWSVAIHLDDPQNWLMERFLKDGPWSHPDSGLSNIEPTFTFLVDDVSLRLALNVRTVPTTEGKSKSAVAVDCNLHHEGPLDAGQLRDAIAQWPMRQRLIVTTLDELIGDIDS